MSNEVFRGDGFFVSFNPSTGTDRATTVLKMLDEMLEILHQQHGFPEPVRESGPETALIRKGLRREGGFRFEYRILRGDWRKEYRELIPQGWTACLAFYNSKKFEHGSEWSTQGLDDDAMGAVLAFRKTKH